MFDQMALCPTFMEYKQDFQKFENEKGKQLAIDYASMCYTLFVEMEWVSTKNRVFCQGLMIRNVINVITQDILNQKQDMTRWVNKLRQ